MFCAYYESYTYPKETADNPEAAALTVFYNKVSKRINQVVDDDKKLVEDPEHAKKTLVD